MARTQTMVQLNDELIGELDSLASKNGVSRSALIRTVLEDFLVEIHAADVGRKIAIGYEKFPPSTPDSWGDVDKIGEHGAAELVARLDLEERKADHAPW